MAPRILLPLLATSLLANASLKVDPSVYRNFANDTALEAHFDPTADVISGNYANYENCTTDAVKTFEAYIPDQIAVLEQTTKAMKFLNDNFDEVNHSKTLTLARGNVTLGDLRGLAKALFGDDVVHVHADKAGADMATPLKAENSIRLKNFQAVLDTFHKIGNVIRRKPTISCISCLGGAIATESGKGDSFKMLACPASGNIRGTIDYFDTAPKDQVFGNTSPKGNPSVNPMVTRLPDGHVVTLTRLPDGHLAYPVEPTTTFSLPFVYPCAPDEPRSVCDPGPYTLHRRDSTGNINSSGNPDNTLGPNGRPAGTHPAEPTKPAAAPLRRDAKGKPVWDSAQQWFIHSAAHLNGALEDRDFLQYGPEGAKECGVSGIRSAMSLAKNNSYLARRNPEGFSNFVFGVEWLVRGYGVPTFTEFPETDNWNCHNFKAEDLQGFVKARLAVIDGAQAVLEEIDRINLFH